MLGILICTEKYSFVVSPTAVPLLLLLFFAVDEKRVLTRKVIKMSIPLSANSQADGKENVLWTTDFGTLTDFSVCLLAFKLLQIQNKRKAFNIPLMHYWMEYKRCDRGYLVQFKIVTMDGK